MTKAEFNQWWAGLSTAFPSRCANISNKTLAVWYTALDRVDLSDALNATAALVSGTIQVPYYWDEIPAIVAKWCRERRYDRTHGGQEWRKAPPDEKPQPGHLAALKACLAISKHDADHRQKVTAAIEANL